MSEDYSAWVGRTESATDLISPTPARALLATIDRDPSGLGAGDALPPLFHWLYCRELAPHRRLGEDGHREKGEFLPPVRHPRRMWAGGRLRFDGDLTIGQPVERLSTVKSVTPKEGGSGPMVVITVEHRYMAADCEVLEEQDLIYLERPQKPLALDPSPAPEAPVDWSAAVVPDVAMLFRFSALTFNAHRIHYDRDFARGIEGYPDLVVHGPLTALLLADLAGRGTGRPLAGFSFRARRPLFVDRPITLEGRRDGEVAVLRALDDTGSAAMTAEAELG